MDIINHKYRNMFLLILYFAALITYYVLYVPELRLTYQSYDVWKSHNIDKLHRVYILKNGEYYHNEIHLRRGTHPVLLSDAVLAWKDRCEICMPDNRVPKGMPKYHKNRIRNWLFCAFTTSCVYWFGVFYLIKRWNGESFFDTEKN